MRPRQRACLPRTEGPSLPDACLVAHHACVQARQGGACHRDRYRVLLLEPAVLPREEGAPSCARGLPSEELGAASCAALVQTTAGGREKRSWWRTAAARATLAVVPTRLVADGVGRIRCLAVAAPWCPRQRPAFLTRETRCCGVPSPSATTRACPWTWSSRHPSWVLGRKSWGTWHQASCPGRERRAWGQLACRARVTCHSAWASLASGALDCKQPRAGTDPRRLPSSRAGRRPASFAQLLAPYTTDPGSRVPQSWLVLSQSVSESW